MANFYGFMAKNGAKIRQPKSKYYLCNFMGRGNRNKPDKIFEDVEIIDIAEEGKGVGKTDEFVLFVEKAIPGDIADVLVYRSKKNFGEGRILNLKKASDHRVQAFCEHFGTCGGCKWQHMSYDAQLKFKQ